jgi:hypothetical protein
MGVLRRNQELSAPESGTTMTSVPVDLLRAFPAVHLALLHECHVIRITRSAW